MCEETMRADRTLVIAKTLPDRMLLHMSYFDRTPSPGVRRPGDAWRWLRARGGIVISVRAGAGRIVSGRPARELTCGEVTGEDGWCGGVEGIDADAVVCMEMDVMTGLAARRRGLVFGARRSSRGTSTMISTSSSESSSFFVLV